MDAQRTLAPRTTRRKARAAFALLAIVITTGLATQVSSADEGREEVESARTALQAVVENNRLISKERNDWELDKEFIRNRIELLKTEIESLKAATEAANQEITDKDKERDKLVESNQRLVDATATLRESVAGYEARAKSIIPKLPLPLQDRLDAVAQGLPEKPEESEEALSERFLNVVFILNQINKFNLDITRLSEVRTLESGEVAEVTSFYLGIGQAYSVGKDGKGAALGTSSEEGWVWRPMPSSAGQIAQAIAILKNEETASFVSLPIRIQ